MPDQPETCTNPDCVEPAPYVVNGRYACVRHILWAAQQSGEIGNPVVYAPGWRPVHDGE